MNLIGSNYRAVHCHVLTGSCCYLAWYLNLSHSIRSVWTHFTLGQFFSNLFMRFISYFINFGNNSEVIFYTYERIWQCPDTMYLQWRSARFANHSCPCDKSMLLLIDNLLFGKLRYFPIGTAQEIIKLQLYWFEASLKFDKVINKKMIMKTFWSNFCEIFFQYICVFAQVFFLGFLVRYYRKDFGQTGTEKRKIIHYFKYIL